MTDPVTPFDPHLQVLIAYAEMGVCNPLSLATLDKVLGEARLTPGVRTLDLGCGNATVSVHLAERHGLTVDALERSPAICALARERIARLRGPGTVTLHQALSTDFLPTQAPFELIVALGVSAVVTGAPEPARVFAALKPHVAPGGWLLWGDPYLRRELSEQMRTLMGPYAAYLSNVDNVAAGEGVGLTCVFAAASTEQDWDDYSWTINAVVERWLAANPMHPEADGVRARARFLRAAYLAEGREALGFGLYLFRAPA